MAKGIGVRDYVNGPAAVRSALEILLLSDRFAHLGREVPSLGELRAQHA